MVSLRQREVDLRVKYDGIKTPSRALARVLSDRTKPMALYRAISRQVQLICSHSSRWDEGEVTIFDRTLVAMFEEGMPLQNIGLLELFMTEYVGLHLYGSIEEEDSAVNTFLAAYAPKNRVPAVTDSPLVFQGYDDGDYHSIDHGDHDNCGMDNHDEHSLNEGSKMSSLKSEGGCQDDKQSSHRKETLLHNLIQVYQAAKADYYLSDADKSGVSSKKTDKFSNVRFLRDSSDNLLRWMKTEGYDEHPLLREVQKVSIASRGHADHLAGTKGQYERRDVGSHGRHRRGLKRRRGQVDSYRPEK